MLLFIVWSVQPFPFNIVFKAVRSRVELFFRREDDIVFYKILPYDNL